jgi:hypothetical protein
MGICYKRNSWANKGFFLINLFKNKINNHKKKLSAKFHHDSKKVIFKNLHTKFTLIQGGA